MIEHNDSVAFWAMHALLAVDACCVVVFAALYYAARRRRPDNGTIKQDNNTEKADRKRDFLERTGDDVDQRTLVHPLRRRQQRRQ